jgi:tetratricopeptide (TPR) repeat protein
VKANIAQIYIYQNRNLEAVPILKKILKKEPDHTFANQRLIEIHDYFVEKADELATVGKHSSAATFCEKALTTLRLPATLKRAEEVYRNLMNFDKAEALLKEYKKAKTTERAERKEKKRLNLIKKGKEHLKNRAFDKAIEALEEALPMETDKDVFVLLAYILKKRGRTDELENLLARWKKMVSEEGIRLDQI